MGLLGDLGGLFIELLASVNASRDACWRCMSSYTKKKWNGKGFDTVWMCRKTKKEVNRESLCQHYVRDRHR